VSFLNLYKRNRQKEQRAVELCKKHLDKIQPHPDYKDDNNPTRGKCYPASIALLKYLGGVRAGYHLNRAEEEDIGSHYWVTFYDGTILDPTAEQFVVMRRTPPYRLGEQCSFQPQFSQHKPLLEAMQNEDKERGTSQRLPDKAPNSPRGPTTGKTRTRRRKEPG
jgi:hypothetical protein